MTTVVVILITIVITAPVAAIAASYVEYSKQYNLWDWLKDKFNALRGKASAEVRIVVNTAEADRRKLELVLNALPSKVKSAIASRL